MAAATLTTIAIGAAIGAGVGAVATYAGGGRGDAIWKGALTGAVSGAVTGGVGSWAGGALGATAGGALAGAAGGVTAGALGTALSGGTGQDYLKNILTGGLGGAALGAAGGYLSGGEAAATAGTAGTEGGAIGGTEAGLAQGGTGLETGGAMGLGGGTGTTGVETSITGPVAATPAAAPVTTPLADTVSALDTGGAMAGGGSTVAPALETTAATPKFDFASANQQGQQSLQNLGLAPTGEGQTLPSISGTSMAPATQAGNESPTGFWDNFLGSAKTTGTGKMGLEDYLKMQGKAQLLGGGIKALGAIATAPETQQNRNQLMDLYNQQQQQAQYYDDLMRGTYTNPQGYLGSPEAAATRSAALQKILAQNAAAGRRTAGGAAYNQLMMNQLQNLNAYRQGMPRPSYGAALQTLQGAQQYSPTADIFGGVASMATPLSLYSLFG